MTDPKNVYQADSDTDLEEQAVNRAFTAMEQTELEKLKAEKLAPKQAEPVPNTGKVQNIFDELLGTLSDLKTHKSTHQTDETHTPSELSDGIPSSVKENGSQNAAQRLRQSISSQEAGQTYAAAQFVTIKTEQTNNRFVPIDVQASAIQPDPVQAEKPAAIPEIKHVAEPTVKVQVEQVEQPIVQESQPETEAEVSAPVVETVPVPPAQSLPLPQSRAIQEDDSLDVEESTEFLYSNEFRSKREWLTIAADKAKLLIMLDTFIIVALLIAGVVFWQIFTVPLLVLAPFALFAFTSALSLLFALRAASLNSADRAVFSSEKYWKALSGSQDDVQEIHDYLHQELLRLDATADKQIRVINTAYAIFYLGLQLGVWTFVAIRFIFNR